MGFQYQAVCLQEQKIANQGLETPLKKNMKDTKNKNFVKKLKF